MSRHIRKSPVDGQWRRWELVPASSLGLIDPEEADKRRSDGTKLDWMVQTCTGVFASKVDAKRATYGRR